RSTIKLASTPTTLIPQPPRLMRARGVGLAAFRVAQDTRAAPALVEDKAFPSTLAALIFPTSAAVPEEIREPAAVDFATYFPTSFLEAVADALNHAVPNRELISSIRSRLDSGKRSAAR